MQFKIDDFTIGKMERLRASGKTLKQIAAQCDVGMTSVRTYTLHIKPEPVEVARPLKGRVRSIKGAFFGKVGRLIRQVKGGDEFRGYSLVKMATGEEWILTDWLEGA